MKLPRAAYAIWLSFDKTEWTLIGKDTDSLTYELNPDVETTKNVLGETIVNHSGYQPELAVQREAFPFWPFSFTPKSRLLFS